MTTQEREALSCRNLAKSYGGVDAVRSVSLAVGYGEIVGVIGPNGSGKTTTFDMLAGNTEPDAGEVRIAGKLVERSQPHQLARMGLGRTFQLTRLFLELTVYENLASSIGRPNSELWAGVDELLTRIGLADRLSTRAGSLSFGQQKLVEVVRALVRRPEVLLLDEPFAGINETMEVELAELIKYVQFERETAIVLIDHEMRMIRSLCDRVYLLEQGQVVMDGPTEMVLTDERTKEAYFGDIDGA